MHISHGLFWHGEDGTPPPPFTVITHADVQAGKWTPVDPSHKVRRDSQSEMGSIKVHDLTMEVSRSPQNN